MDRQWIARRYQSGDEVQILQLRRLVFGDTDERRNTERYWRWEFLDNPAGQATIWLAEDGGMLVGQYAVRPIRMQCCGEVILASSALDAMTHPDYRRHSVFGALGAKIYEDLESEGLPLTYIFPRKISMLASIAKHDFIYVCSLPVCVKPIRVSRIVDRWVTNRPLAGPIKSVAELLSRHLFKPRNTFRLEEGSEIRWIERFDERMDAFWEAIAPRHRIAVVRDSTYLNWRYFDNPGRQYRALIAETDDEILGYVIVRCMDQFGLRGGMIVDLGVLPNREPVLGVLLAEAEDFFREQSMDLVACLINGDNDYVGLLRKQGLLPLPKRLGFKEWYFAVRLNTPTLDKEFSTDPSNWFLTFGDTDII